ncbi:hypothetical protein K6V18_20070 [Ralstonia insidiosa]|uniref:ParM/StbA family protein n=1 Tax=Ralstonia TaxID=48736 RepID=UPI00066EC208|nr:MULTISPECIES: hypothetical protein [Ralstonia]MBY4707327.1 hypothetical protein [Ralstonia insidiosa]GAQ29087.1 hypothetical protein SAMD00023378_2770 [Ralstonia sp. NT80]
MENIVDVFGCDIGYFGVKAAYRNRGAVETFSFPSVVSRATQTTLRTSADFFGKNPNRLEINIGEATYSVDTSMSALPSSALARTEVDNFPRTETYAALVLACLQKIRASRVRCLVLGLPLHTLEKHAGYLKSRFSGVHRLGALCECVVDKVVVLPQPLGAFAALRAQRLISAERCTNTCIVDVGWHTSDAIVIEQDGTPDLSRSVGLPSGAARVVRAVAGLVGEKTGSRVDNLDRIDYALRTGEPLSVAGELVDLRPLLRTALQGTQEVADAVMTALRTGEDLAVFVSGGGARFYADALSKSLGFAVRHVDRSHLMNVLGFLAAAEAAIGVQGIR